MATPQAPTPTVTPALRTKIKGMQLRAKSLIYCEPLRGYTQFMEGLFGGFMTRRARAISTPESQMTSSDGDNLDSTPQREQCTPGNSGGQTQTRARRGHQARYHTHGGGLNIKITPPPVQNDIRRVPP
ncbi:hypothetical protein M407DRAFT_24948 [Tulasnella calospora MUT 4182]|uniref:Uncharacterized protein n=1 Tax=Tulasnella calospora MUT 4182 TaxID=1051891 RepID=A0A0C3KW39_9AGAM|nr:hypothetical protein M407DRAFT_24948 [Tulasnella calospora MUT 4182]